MDNEIAKYIDKWEKSRCLSKVPKVIPDSLLTNKEFVLGVLNRIEIAFPILEVVSTSLRKDKDVITAALKNNVDNWKYIPKDILYNKDIFLLVFSYTDNHYLLKGMPESLRDDKEVMLEVVKKNGQDFAQASKRLKDDDEVAFTAVKTSINPLTFVSDRLKKNKQLVLAALQDYNDPSSGSEFAAINRIIPELRDDKDIALALVRGSGYNLHYLSDRLKDDEEIVKIAISHPHELSDSFIGEYPNKVEFSYQYASPRLKANPEIISLAVRNNPALYSRLPEVYRNNKEMAFEACKEYKDNIARLPLQLKDDKDFILSLMDNVEPMTRVYSEASNKVKEDIEVVEKVLAYSLKSYDLLPYKYKMDEKIIRRVLKGDVLYIGGGPSIKYIVRDGKYYASITYSRKGMELASNIVKAFGKAFNEYQKDIDDVSDSLKPGKEEVDKTIEFETSKQDIIDSFNNTSSFYPSYLLCEELQNDEELILALLNKGISSLYFCSNKLKEDINFIKKALNINYSESISYISGPIWENDEFVKYVFDLWEKKGESRGCPYDKLPDRYKNNREYALRAIRLNNSCYHSLPSELKKDKEIGLLVINKAPRLLEYLDPTLKDDVDIVSIAIKEDRHLLRYASPRVRELLKK